MEADSEQWIGRSVAQVLEACGTRYDEVVAVDEPPGKLGAVEFVCHRTDPPRRLRVRFAYDATLFSTARHWSRSLVEAQTVTVVESLGGAR